MGKVEFDHGESADVDLDVKDEAWPIRLRLTRELGDDVHVWLSRAHVKALRDELDHALAALPITAAEVDAALRVGAKERREAEKARPRRRR